MDPSTTQAAAEFAEVAVGFCDWCENTFDPSSAEVAAASWLASLYARALALPHVGPENSNDPPDLPPDTVEKVKRNLRVFDGCYYREFFNSDPTSTEEPVIGDLGDDLQDIYQDIKVGLVLFNKGEIENALWYWSFLHKAHWGHHAASAILALHNKAVAL